MTIDEAIKHCEEVAKLNERMVVRNRRHGGYVYEAEARTCEKCAMEHHQLVEWLKELKSYKNEDPITWDELCAMEGEPVWLEWSSDSGAWVLIAYKVDNDLKYFRYCDDRIFTLTRDNYEHDKWQAYRKERTDVQS